MNASASLEFSRHLDELILSVSVVGDLVNCCRHVGACERGRIVVDEEAYRDLSFHPAHPIGDPPKLGHEPKEAIFFVVPGRA